MAETVQINLRVAKETKEKWEEFIDETAVSPTISHLIRTSVESTIEEHHEESEDDQPEFSQDLEEMQEDIESIQSDVAKLLKEQRDEGDISDTAQEVFDELEVLPSPADDLQIPDDADPTTYRRQRAASMMINPSGPDGEPSPQTASSLADRLDEDPNRIDDAIEHLQENFLPVVEVQIGGDRHYFREE